MPISQEKVTGYFTIESNIRWLTPQEIESKLGFAPGRLARGARVLVLDAEPKPGQFEAAGSTLFPGRKGLDLRELERTKFRPGAWLGQRLVKVKAVGVEGPTESFPRASNAAEQWILTENVSAHEVGRLKPGDRYWG